MSLEPFLASFGTPLRLLACIRGSRAPRRTERRPQNHTHPYHPHKSRKDSVGDLVGAVDFRELHTQTTVDNPQGNDHTTDPHMRRRPKGFAVVLLEHVVMNEAEDGLERKEADNSEANYRMICI